MCTYRVAFYTINFSFVRLVRRKDDAERELQQCTVAVFVIREEEDPQSVQSECQALNMELLKERHLDTAC